MQADQRTIKVILVDDDHEFLDATSRYLARHDGIAVVGTMGGVSEVEAFDEAFDVALVDIRMPDGGGLAVLRHLRAKQPNAGIIAISGFNDFGEQEEMMGSGAATFLPKGERLEELVETIRGLHP